MPIFFSFFRYLIRSGSLKHVNDIITNAVFEVLPLKHRDSNTFMIVDRFDEFGMVDGQVSIFN